MKKIFTLIAISFFSYHSFSQTGIENFNYTAGQALTDNGWTVTAANTTNPVTVTAPGLTYTGYAGSGVGNAATLTTTGQDVYRDIYGPVSTGNVYASFLINVSSAQATGDYFFALLPNTSTTNYAARTYIKSSGAGFVLGLSKGNEAAVYGTTVLSLNQTYLVVVKYTLNTGSTTDDAISLYVFSSGVPATEPATPEVGPITTASITDAPNISRIALRQGTASNAPGLVVDGFRVDANWYNAPLPLNLTMYRANLSKGSVAVEWTTTNEVNVKGFSIERSANAQSFSSIGTVEAKAGTSNTYSFSDAKPLPGVGYYRLKMIDKDGAFKYSEILPVTNKASVAINIYPNPVTTLVNVQHGKGEKGAVVRILDLSGKQVLVMPVAEGATQTSINATMLKPGSYMAVHEINGVKTTKQFVKQ